MKIRINSLILFLFGAALAACSEKELSDPRENQPEESGTYSYVFKLDDCTKALYATDHVAWETGDKVGSFTDGTNGASVNKSTAVNVDGDDVTITIRSSVALHSGDKVYAYAPFSSANDKNAATAVRMEIPRNQISGDATSMPLVALPFTLTEDVPSYTDTEVGTLRFLNLGSVIKLNVYSSSPDYQGETVENVSFVANAPIAGTFDYNLTGVNESSPAAISGYSETDVVVTGRGTVGSTKDNAAEFLMIVAPGTVSGQFVIRTDRADYTYSLGEARTFSRAALKPFNIDLASTNWVKHTGYDSSIDSPRELCEFLAGTSASDTGEYTISADLDMTGYTLPSASGFGGTLDGGEHTIYNIASQTALFQTNKGTIKNLTIAGAFTPTSQIFGALVNIDNGGTYDHVTNRATVTFAAAGDVTGGLSIGGFVGATEAGKFTSCTNEGTVLVDIAGKHESAYVAGFAGFTKEHVIIDGCTSAGNVTLRAVCGNPRAGFTILGSEMSTGGIAVGGFIGRANTTAAITTEAEAKSGAAYVNNSPVNADVTLDYSDISAISGDGSNGNVDVAGAVGYGNSYIYKVTNSGDVKAYGRSSSGAAKKEFILHVGGIFGKAYNYTCVGSCRMDGDITVVNDCTGDNANVKAGVGGMAGCGGYNGPTSNGQTDVNYSRVTGDINVSGKGKNMGIGGVIGWNGKQWNNKVDASCKIECSLTGEYAFVGGLVGGVAGGAANYTIKACSCAAEIRTTANKLRTGGLIGNWGGASASGSSACFTYRGTPSEPCSFSGSVYSTNNSQNYVGIIAGYIDGSGKTVVFGDDAADNLKIQVSGTIQKNDMSSPVAITSANFDTYKWGGNKANTTIYLIAPSAPPAPSGTVFKAMSLNIREGSNWSSRKSPICSMINGESPDIIGLQEVKDLDFFDHLSEDHPWDYIKDHVTGYTGVRPNKKGNAFLYKTSRFEISNSGSFDLEDPNYDRCVLYATVHDKTNNKYFFYLTGHFPLGQNARTAAVSTVETKIRELNTSGYPVVLMGDFNGVNSDVCFDNLITYMNNTRYSAEEVYSTENKNLYTYNAFGDSSKDRNKVDHIWVSKTGLFTTYYITLTQEIRKYGSIDYLSDHYPVIATLSF